MSLDNILQALEAEAQGQLTEIEQTTQAEIAQIEADSRLRSGQVRQQRLAEIQGPLQIEQTRLINRAKQKALRIVLGSRENLITRVLEMTAEHLAALARTPLYRQLLRELLQEAIDTLDISGGLHIRVREQDVALAEQIVQEMALSARVEGTLENDGTWGEDLGGLVVATADGRISLVNGLEARLQRTAGLYRTQIAAFIADQQAGG